MSQRLASIDPANRRGRRFMLVTAVLALSAGAVAACGSGTAPAPPGQPAASTGAGQSRAQADRTLASLRRLDDHPLYEMTYVGPALPAPDGSTLPAGAAASAPVAATSDGRALPAGAAASAPVAATGAVPSFACTVFRASGVTGRPVLGRNFDWQANPALVLRFQPTTGGYASIALVDLGYLGDAATRLSGSVDPATRAALLRAIGMPYDGMNERGLAVGMAAVPAAVTEQRRGRPTVDSLSVIRLALDRSATVAEALAVFRSYTVDFTGGPPLHYLIADATGASAVVEYVDGRMRVLPGSGAWQLITNFTLSTATATERSGDWRYTTAQQALDGVAGRLDPTAVLRLLRGVAQPSTQWSVAYDLAGRAALLVTDRRTVPVHRIAIAVPPGG